MTELSGLSRETLQALDKERLIDIVLLLVEENACLKKRNEVLEAKLNANSSNSNRPPSSDSPYSKAAPAKPKTEARKKRPGHRQQMLPPTTTEHITPPRCSCGCDDHGPLQPFYTHQHIELPKIALEVTHFVLLKGRCSRCGKIGKGSVPIEFQTGFGPRCSALIVELAGIAGNSRDMVRTFCASVLELPISLGGIQKVIDRACRAIEPHYEAIKAKARSSPINHLDETPWYQDGKLNWLWVMTNKAVAYFMIHTNRSKAAFNELIGAWSGILVSDNYVVYRNWVNQRQTCLAHLIRRAEGLAQRADPELSRFGRWAAKELQLLCKMAHAPPTVGQWRAFYARLCRLIALYQDSSSEAGTFARRLDDEMESLFLCIEKEAVEPTNNFAERMIRFGVLWRKRSQGTRTDKGCRWVERILSLRQTCRLHGTSTFATLVDAMTCYFKEQEPELDWIRLAGD